jgi:hypothetical protein
LQKAHSSPSPNYRVDTGVLVESGASGLAIEFVVGAKSKKRRPSITAPDWISCKVQGWAE